MSYRVIDFPNSDFPRDEHYISLIQLEPPITNTIPAVVDKNEAYRHELFNAVKYTIVENKSNIIVFPEISIPSDILLELILLGIKSFGERESDYRSCVVCFPLEHLLIDQFLRLFERLSQCNAVGFSDQALNKGNVLGKLFQVIRKIDEEKTFVNVAVIMVLNKTADVVDCQIVFQPKIFPAKVEVDCEKIFAKGQESYILKLNGIHILSCICFDFIANDDNPGYYIVQLFEELHLQHIVIDYLLLPQCNSRALDRNYAETLNKIYTSQVHICV